MKAGVLKNHSSLSNENKSEGTRILEMAIENTKSVVRPSGMPLALSANTAVGRDAHKACKLVR